MGNQRAPQGSERQGGITAPGSAHHPAHLTAELAVA